METKSKIITTERIGQEQREKLKELIDLYANYEPNLLMNPDWKIIGKEYYVPDVLKVLDRIKLGKSYSDLKLIAYKPREYEFETILAWYTAFDGTMPDGKPLFWIACGALSCHYGGMRATIVLESSLALMIWKLYLCSRWDVQSKNQSSLLRICCLMSNG